MRKCRLSIKKPRNKSIRISKRLVNQFQEMAGIKSLIHPGNESMSYLFNIIFNDFHQRFIIEIKNRNIKMKKEVINLDFK